jgi:hypothetical protein
MIGSCVRETCGDGEGESKTLSAVQEKTAKVTRKINESKVLENVHLEDRNGNRSKITLR